MLVFFTNLSLIGFQVSYLALFHLFSVIDNFGWFWMETLPKNIQLMLEFLKALFLVLHFFYNTLTTFLTLFIILQSMLMILLSTLFILKYDQVSDLQQQIELASELESELQSTVNWSRKWPVHFNSGKNNLFCLASILTLKLLMQKLMGLFLRKIIFEDDRVVFLSKSRLELLHYIPLLLKLPPRKLEP